MGVLRFILAMAVVIAHSSHYYGSSLYGIRLTGGVIAVQAFYMISGFYMSLILAARYTGDGSYRLFITNRALRIYPVYWAVMLLTVALSFFHQFDHIFGFSAYDFFAASSELSIGTRIYLTLASIGIFGQSAVLFQGVDAAGEVYFTANFHASSPELFTFLPVPQAWTLSLELMFYLIAPILASRSTRFLLGLIAVGLALRGYIYFDLGLFKDPWTYRFFPTELAFFLAGMISHRLYSAISRRELLFMKGLPVLAAVTAVSVLLQFLPGYAFKQWSYYLLIFLAMPFLFDFSRSFRSVDDAIGELSYPIYISHVFVMFLLSPVFTRGSATPHATAVVCASTIAFSMLLIYFLIKPVDRIRAERVRMFNLRQSPYKPKRTNSWSSIGVLKHQEGDDG